MSGAPYSIRQADQDELDAVMEIIDQRIAWLRERGTDQWSTRPFRPRLAESIAAGETWLVFDDDQPVATITDSREGDPDFWTAEELKCHAVYLGKLATRIDQQGKGLGDLMLQWACDRAARTGIDLLRWDVWKTNHDLQTYYRDLGGRYLRTVEAAGRRSGALFEMPAVRIPEITERIVEITGRNSDTPTNQEVDQRTTTSDKTP